MNAGFDSNPTLTILPRSAGARRWELVGGLDYRTVDGDRMHISHLFRTDLASIPRGLRWLTASDADTAAAAILHDWLYQRGGRIEVEDRDKSVKTIQLTRKDADLIFYRALVVTSVSPWTTWILWRGVRWGGWYSWNRYRRGKA